MKQASPLPLVMVVFDGWGIAPPGPGKAITQAATPAMDDLTRHYPSSHIVASGAGVGLPTRQEGNSEAGHMNIGAGRVVEQDSVRISKSINDGSFFKNAAFLAAIHHVNKYRSQLHLMGLLTQDQSGHADPDHLLALLTMARMKRVRKVVLHLFTDGRDSPPRAAVQLFRKLEGGLKQHEVVGSIIGRFYAMDRKKNWTSVRRAFETMVSGKGRKAKTAEQAILDAYDRNETDEFIQPTVIGASNRHRIGSDDAVIFFNLRSDRARELTKVFVQKDFTRLNPKSFRPLRRPRNLLFVAMTDFGPDLGEIYTAYPSVDLYQTLPVVLRSLRQLYVAESEKYAHVKFFFNGGYDKPVAGEDRVLVPSPNVSSYDTTPAMSAHLITDRVVADLKLGAHDLIVVNFANTDMVGHTGNLKATIRAVQAVDACVGRIRDAVRSRNGTLLVTADHGNAESMLSDDGKSVDTEHTSNPVPLIIAPSDPVNFSLRPNGRLADVAPTVLDLLNQPKPAAMTGQSLIQRTHAT
ncbi:MAG: 2,3-bisphosphoglycerate-independent phosphoglycerate mutase [Candidatus Kerfeldbacteria bacterium]|nr:2,3-bisphosphoglycerate-independent phosphoglycerate mutase [Candidatus Kerfeldbacteria bacterium]